jgi:hypothetical protein
LKSKRLYSFRKEKNKRQSQREKEKAVGKKVDAEAILWK